MSYVWPPVAPAQPDAGTQVYGPLRTTFYALDARNEFPVGEPGIYKDASEDMSITTANKVNFQNFVDGSGEAHVDVALSQFHGAAFYVTSDETKKSNIVSLEYQDAKDKLDALRATHFTLNDDAEGQPRYGFIAQEVQKVCPEMVTTRHDGILALDQVQIMALVVRVMQGAN
jgi:hypothetical protein